MRFGLSLPMQHPMGDDMSQRFAELRPGGIGAIRAAVPGAGVP